MSNSSAPHVPSRNQATEKTPAGTGPQPSSELACGAPQVIRRRKPKSRDRYVIERLIGQGGMGAVYQARDCELDRVVALKLLHPGFALDDELEQRLKKELLLAGTISHPRVVRVHDFGQLHGNKFISMAFIDGENLKCLLKRAGRLPIPRVLHIATQLCEGLNAAHSAGVIHRDLKPQNILLDRSGDAYIADFGLARSFKGLNIDVAGPGERPGSPAYMSPEQALGLPVDHRSDIYALGLVLYEMATGTLPASATASFLSHSRFECRIKGPSALNAEVPEALERLILSCLEVDPAKRPQDAIHVLKGLNAHPPEEPMAPDPAKKRQKKRQAALGIAMLVALVMAFGIWRIGQRNLQAREHSSPTKLAIATLRAIGDDESLHVVADTLTEVLSLRAAQSGRVRLILDDGPGSGSEACTARAEKVITGSVRSEKNQILASIRMTDCATRETRWAGQFRTDPRRTGELGEQIWTAMAGILGWNTDPQPMPAVLHATQNLEAYKLYMQGRLLLRLHRNRSGAEQAMRLFEQSSKQDPKYFYPWAGLADANLVIFKGTHEGPYLEKARQCASHAQELSGSRPEAQLEVAKIKIATGQYDEATQLLQRAIEMNPASDEAYRTLGRAKLASGNADEAIAAYRRAVDLDAHSWLNHNALGVALFSLSRLAEAETAFQKAIQLEPQIGDNYTDLGNAYLVTGRFQESVGLFEKAIALEADGVNYSNLGTALFYLGQYDTAASVFEKAVHADPRSETVMGNLADAYRWTNRKREAMETYFRAVALGAEALAVNPRDAGVRGRMAVYYAKMDDFEAARSSVLAARALAPEDAFERYYEAVVSTLAFNLARAESELRSAVKSGYPAPLALNDPELRPLHPDKILGSLAVSDRRPSASRR